MLLTIIIRFDKKKILIGTCASFFTLSIKTPTVSKKEFLQLLDKYLAGKASLDEEELLVRIYESHQHEWDSDELAAINSLEDKLFERIESAIDLPEEPLTPQIRYLPVRRFLVAASVILSIASGLLFLLKSQHTTLIANKKSILKNDFKPGGNNAYLVLSNGKKVILNQAKAGVLALQGQNAVIKQNDGKILYSKNNISAALKDSIPFNKIVVPVGGQYSVTLSDGTNVWLNSSSSLEYPVQFSGKERKIKLTGEAYFEVAKNKSMPFIVNVNEKMNVKVLGTHFNIMAYDDENKISTTLLEGSVKIEDQGNPANNTFIIPGQQANLLNSGKIKIEQADVDEVIAWKEGQFLFNNEDIHSIMRKLSRWYDVQVVFSKDMKNKSFDGSISRYKNISEVLKLMELTKSIHFKFEERRILVMP